MHSRHYYRLSIFQHLMEYEEIKHAPQILGIPKQNTTLLAPLLHLLRNGASKEVTHLSPALHVLKLIFRMNLLLLIMELS